MKHTLYILAILSLLACQNKTEPSDRIALLMQAQEDAWNAGDLEGFMQAYWPSDSLRFIGSRGLSYGWETTLNNYKKSYPDKASMGQLKFERLYQKQLSPEQAFTVGKWTLFREQDTLSGHFTLLWEKIEGDWRITVDHSS